MSDVADGSDRQRSVSGGGGVFPGGRTGGAGPRPTPLLLLQGRGCGGIHGDGCSGKGHPREGWELQEEIEFLVKFVFEGRKVGRMGLGDGADSD